MNVQEVYVLRAFSRDGKIIGYLSLDEGKELFIEDVDCPKVYDTFEQAEQDIPALKVKYNCQFVVEKVKKVTIDLDDIAKQ